MKKRTFKDIHKMLAVLCAVSIFLTAIPLGGLYTQVYAEETGEEEPQKEEPAKEEPAKDPAGQSDQKDEPAQEDTERSAAIEVGGSPSEGTKAGDELYLTVNSQPVAGAYSVKVTAPGASEAKTAAGSDGRYVLAEKAVEGTYTVNIIFEPEKLSAGVQTKEVTYKVASAPAADPEPESDPEPKVIETVDIIITSNHTDGFEAGKELYISVNDQPAAGTYSVQVKAPGAEEYTSVSASEGRYILAAKASQGDYSVKVTFTPDDSNASTRTAEKTYTVAALAETEDITVNGSEDVSGMDAEIGKPLAITLNDQPAPGKYTVKVTAPGEDEGTEIQGTDRKYELPTDKLGEYKVSISFVPNNESAQTRNKSFNYKVFKTLDIRAGKDDEGNDAVISKESDGTTALVFKDGDEAADYFTVEDMPEGLKLKVDASGWEYKSELPITPADPSVGIVGVDADDFSFEGTDGEYYRAGSFPNPVAGEILPVKIEDIDLTKGSAEVKLSDDVAVNFQFPENGYVNGWINAAKPNDHFVFQEEQIPIDEGMTYIIETFLADKDTELVPEGPESPVYTLTEGKEVKAEDLYILREGIYYGPVSIKYNRDTEAPDFGKVELTVKNLFSWIFNNAEKAKPGVDYEITEDLAIVASGEDITVNVSAEGEDEENGHSAQSYVYLSDTKLTKTEMEALSDETFKAAGHSATIKEAGRKYVYVRTIDQAGNKITGIVEGAILSDKNKPTIVSYEISEDGSQVKVTVRDGAEGNEADESGISEIRLVTYALKEGESGDSYEKVSEEPLSFGDYTGANNGTKSNTFNVTEYGVKLKVEVFAKDYAGNEATSGKSAEFSHFHEKGYYTANFEFEPEAKEAYADGKYYYQTRELKLSAPNGFPGTPFSFKIKDTLKDSETVYNWDEMEYRDGAYVHDDFSYEFTDSEYAVSAEEMDHLVINGLVDGNKEFIVDGLKPVVTVSVNDADANFVNDKYYFGLTDHKTNDEAHQEAVTFTVKVEEKYFDEALADVQINGEKQNVTWTTDENGNHIAEITRKMEGTYELTASCSDPAENSAEEQKITAVIDYTSPVVTLEGSGDTANYFEGEGAYFNEAFTYTFNVDEVNFLSEDFASTCTFTSVDGTTDADKKPSIDEDAKTWTWTVDKEEANNGEYVFTFSGCDRAGNLAVFDIAADDSFIFKDDTAVFGTDAVLPACVEVYSTGKKILDTVSPVAEYKEARTGEGTDGTEKGNTFENDDKTYYNTAFKVVFTLDELHFAAAVPGTEADADQTIGLTAEKTLDGNVTDVTVDTVEVNGNEFIATVKADISQAAAEAENKKNQEEAAEDEVIPLVIPDEGEYQFTFSGCDKAGNPVEVIYAEGAEEEKEDLGHTYTEEPQGSDIMGVYVTGIKVLDITAPVFRKTIEADKDIKADNIENTTAYYNKNITVTWDITEKYFDSNSIGAGMNVDKSDNYQAAANSISWKKPDLGAHSSSGQSYTVSTSEDGVYAFTLAGTDKAGNLLAQSAEEAAIGENWKQTRKNADGEYWTYAKVVDTVAPNGYLTIKNNGGTEYYKYAVGSGEGVDYSEPYRKGETFATVNIAVTKDHFDHSPVKINYNINSSNTSWTQKVTDGDYAYMQSKSKGTVDGAQYIQVVDIVLTDRAGNETKTSSPNKMSLDNGIPTDDELAPTIQMTVRSNSSEFGPLGQPLYRTKNGGNYGTLTVDLAVNDPNPNSSSSGLDSVVYELYINGAKVNTSAELISASGDYHQTEFNDDYTDTDPIVTFKYNIPVDGKTYNYNDVKIIAYAKDRAGHTTEREIAFGIDNTEPEITVSFDNNSAQNGKYFKENRVATVTVRERNFDANAVNITTQAAATQSGWTPHYDHSGNGDNTTWTKTITYATDGDYTLDVTAKDLLGWDAGKADYGNSVAPQEFTIDKTKPVITISFDNTNLKNTVNGTEYYDAARVATILVKEHNFGKGDVRKENIEASNPDPAISLAKPGLNGWNNNGDNHTATVSCTADGVYRITFDYTDLAGNVAEQVTTAQYVVDTTQPTAEWVAGSVKNETAYPGTIAPAVEVADTFMNWDGVTFDLVGARNGKVTVTEQDMEHISDFLGRKSYNNFPVQRKYDDIYTLTAHVIDLSGNEQTIKISFSVNRFGSTWDYNNDPVTIDVVDRYYINQEKPIVIREINPTKVTEWHTYLSHAGEYKELKEGTDFTMVPNTSGKSGWNEYVYHFNEGLFEEEGLYEVYVQTTDEAKNPNSNGSVHGDDDKTYEVVPRFIVDKTNPRSTLSDATDMSKHQYLEDEVAINIVPTDNYALARVDIYINDELRDSFFNDPENENYRLRDTLEANDNTIPWILSSKDAAQILRVECFDAAGNRSGYSIQNEFIDSPDDPEILTWNVVVTKNVAIQYINNRLALGGTGLGILLILLLLFLKRKKDEEKKKAAA